MTISDLDKALADEDVELASELALRVAAKNPESVDYGRLLGVLSRGGPGTGLERHLDAATARLDGAGDPGSSEALTLREHLVEANLLLGRADRAIALAEARPVDERPLSYRMHHARALARAGRLDEARAVFNEQVSEREANAACVHRARAEIAHAAGDADRAHDSMCAAIFEAGAAHGMQDDPAYASIADERPTIPDAPIRPRRVPADAVFADDRVMGKVWVAGTVDADGRRQGPHRWFRLDGSKCCDSTFEKGVQVGPWTRYHENGEKSGQGTLVGGESDGTRAWFACEETTSELMHVGVDLSVRRTEHDYSMGRLLTLRHFDKDDRRVLASGAPYPQHPPGVPADADWDDDHDHWVQGRWQFDDPMHRGARPVDIWRYWDADGRHTEEQHHDDTGEVTRNVYFPASEEFPKAASKVVRFVRDEEAGHLCYDEDGRETLLDGAPVDQLRNAHPGLVIWFEQLEGLDLSGLEDGDGEAVRNAIRGALAQGDDSEDSPAAVAFEGLTDRLGTESILATLPLLTQLAGYERFARGPELLDFLNATMGEVSTDEDERDETETAIQRAFSAESPRWIELLRHPGADVRTQAARTLAMLSEAEGVEASLVALETERDDVVRAAIHVGLSMNHTRDAKLRKRIDAVVAADAERDDLVGFAARTTAAIRAKKKTSPDIVETLRSSDCARVLEYDQGMKRTRWPTSSVDALGTALYAVGLDVQDGIHLTRRFGEIEENPDAIGLVASAIWLALEEDMTRALRKVLLAVCDTPALWTDEQLPTLSMILDQFSLPDDLDELRELADDEDDEDEDEDD
ncbi:bacterial transcriptional activator domain-containing protein [Nannocystis radixulma]|uniref:Bacterial transcriptional activator domain-containing protein n=1 Tax=Nannocystis radixulma TaxID=2995305 RepID=A0ABT5B900_9BACT|nr:bacterial transcriptional activator domain-containing protein [Nannocystis radixulma]MDC0670609.1 bacterial transcriptional activator domain-containing protein [Nannocystis radixulma]